MPQISLPYPDAHVKERYGRLSTLAQVPELAEAALYPIGVSSVVQALAMLDALP